MPDQPLSRQPEREPNWFLRETPVSNWALVAFFILTINGVVDLVSHVF